MAKHLTKETLEKNRIRNRKHYHENKEYYTNWGKYNVDSRLCSVAKQRAKKKNIPFTLKKTDINLPTHCPILGIKLEYNLGTGSGGKDNSYSLDRIDPSKGYTPDNIQVISHKANSMKFTATPEELLSFADWVYRTYKNE